MTQITEVLMRLFERHRVVQWFDTKEELQREFDAAVLPGIEKIAVNNNEFGVKHCVLREEPDRKFLIYHAGPPPADPENWLLDVQLADGEFRADQVSLWLSEVGLGMEFSDAVAPHTAFFQAAGRREALKAALEPDDPPRMVRLKMLAVCCGAEPRLDEIAEALLAELAADRDDRIRLVQRAGLDAVLWDEMARAWGYASETPGMHDFAIALFASSYRMDVGDDALAQCEEAALSADAAVFLKRWKDSVRHHRAFETLSRECAGVLGIAADLANRSYSDLLGTDIFELIDQKIVSDLVRGAANQTMRAGEIADAVRQRRQSHWYERYRHEYAAIEHAAAFVAALDGVDLAISSFAGAIQQYTGVWYKLDQHYRKHVTHLRQSGQTTLLQPLSDRVENLYTNGFLLKVNNAWQAEVSATERWGADGVVPQQDFFEWQVKPFLERGNKVFVIISDALRYEIGEELLRLVRQEDRFDAELVSVLTPLPSFTQLGMAALLPHQLLSLADDGKTALVDGQSASGTANRAKLLDAAVSGQATALRADDFLGMNKEESRALFRDHDVVYIYHNRIDAVGDKRDTEERAFDAVEATLDELLRVIKKLAGANATNMLVTADHGFIYQYQTLDESDFIGQPPMGAQITDRNRRFVLGHGLVESPGYKRFTAAQVGLEGDLEILIPNSINRVRIQGAGSRYVHGGASLQEVIVPVLKVNKKRESDVREVEVDILQGSTQVITTGQLSVVFYQREPASEKVQPRELRAGIYTQENALISDEHDLTFDLVSENERDRETAVRFILTREADTADGQDVALVLREHVPGTSHWKPYRTVRYVLRRAFTSDFDF